ncbi:MAG: glycosyltransferase family 4 protein, partial [Sediminibacterium sp.]|nr:glycosyltransferase family 4 protein [Sediminibacterium sp.]
RFGRLYHLQHVTWLLGQDAKKNNRYAARISLHAGSLAAISDSLADTFYKNYGIRPAYIIPNGIDPMLFSRMEHPRDIEICGAGSLIALKRFDVFIRIIEVVRRSMPGIQVRIAGDGPERKNLQLLVQRAGLEGTIILTGELAHPEMLLLMQRSKIFLHTSSYEGFSGACLEALYAGAHVISFDKPMTGSLPHWHIASGIEQSIDIIHSLLNSPQDHTPVAPSLMDTSARSVMGLFGSEFTAER